MAARAQGHHQCDTISPGIIITPLANDELTGHAVTVTVA